MPTKNLFYRQIGGGSVDSETSGSRLSRGSVPANASFLNIRPDRSSGTELVMCDNWDAVRVTGDTFNRVVFESNGCTTGTRNRLTHKVQ